uniref:X8 domain-containing protein n=1 Tax=Rhizophora mucronata TaxID=61149 RepID=A0A2P2J3E2_RHIMU
MCFHVLLLLLLGAPTSRGQNGVVPRDLWCVAKNNAQDQQLQASIDWACGPGGADCGPIQQGGSCYVPGDIQTMASWAFNDYYLKHGLTDDACYFSNTAALTSLNPSHGNCKFPSSSSVNNGSVSGSTETIGVSPDSADLSGSSQTAGKWFWPLAASFYVGFIVMGHWGVLEKEHKV